MKNTKIHHINFVFILDLKTYTLTLLKRRGSNSGLWKNTSQFQLIFLLRLWKACLKIGKKAFLPLTPTPASFMPRLKHIMCPKYLFLFGRNTRLLLWHLLHLIFCLMYQTLTGLTISFNLIFIFPISYERNREWL